MSFLDVLLNALGFAGEIDPELTSALQLAADRVEPRIRDTRGWPRRFKGPVADALAQARFVAENVPGPVELGPDRFSMDPFIHALFASADDLRRLLGASDPLRKFAAASACDEAFALLSMRRAEKSTFGMEEYGGILRRDVAQHVIWFTDHRLSGPAATLAEARDKLAWSLFGRFLERLAVGAKRLRDEKARLIQVRDVTLSRLKSATQAHRSELQATLKAVLKQLSEVTDTLQLDHLHEVFETVLSHPKDCLYLENDIVSVDTMGVMRPKVRDTSVATLSLTELVERYQERRIVVLVHCHGLQQAIRDASRPDANQWLL